MTAFEQLCNKLGVDQGTREATFVSFLVNDMIFSKANYTDEEIIESVTALCDLNLRRSRSKVCTRPEQNQGYEIIAAETYADTGPSKLHRVVLGRMATQYGTSYVTWDSVCGGTIDGIGFVDYFWGHYFADEKAARADYHKRLAEHYAG